MSFCESKLITSDAITRKKIIFFTLSRNTKEGGGGRLDQREAWCYKSSVIRCQT